jgi:chemotaxis protein histidine kinase CheA
MAVSKKRSNTTRTVATGVFDRAHLAHYTMHSAELEREIIGLFLLQLPSTIELIEDATAAAEWKLATHTLKGAAASIGAGKLQAIATELEDIGFEGDVELRLAGLRQLKAAAAEFRETVRHIYP